MDALVTDAQIRSAVNGIRGLGRAGLSVVAVATRRSAPGLWSRHTTRRVLGPDPATDEAGFVARVCEAARTHSPAVVYPGRERSLDALLTARDLLPDGTLLALPERDALAPLRDKASLGTLAREAGLRTPSVVAEGTAGELLSTGLKLPCIVKPARPDGPLATARLVTTREQLHALVGGLPPHERLVVQERVEGPLTALAVVVDRHGELVARFQQVALRTWPPDLGISALAVGVPPEEDLVRHVVGMLRSVGFWGLAQLQFVGHGARTALIDVNPRFYGSLPLAMASGVNLPASWHAVTLGLPTRGPSAYRTDVKYRWLEADLTAARHGARGRLAPVRGARTGPMWAPDDPLPAALLAWRALRARLPVRR